MQSKRHKEILLTPNLMSVNEYEHYDAAYYDKW